MHLMSLSQAAKWSGKSRSTVFKAIKNGRLSAQKNDIGEFRIDPAELARVYPGAQVDVEIHTQGVQSDIGHETASAPNETALLRAEMAWLREQLAKTEERERQLIALLQAQTRLLTDQRSRAPKWQFWKR